MDSGNDRQSLGTPVFRDNPAQSRFELWVGDELVGILGYTIDAQGDERVVSFMHTVVAEERWHRGLAGRLVAGALDAARDRGLRVRPVCTYVQHYLEQHPAEG